MENLSITLNKIYDSRIIIISFLFTSLVDVHHDHDFVYHVHGGDRPNSICLLSSCDVLSMTNSIIRTCTLDLRTFLAARSLPLDREESFAEFEMGSSYLPRD